MNYIILPFNFKYFNNDVLLVNQAGEHLFLSREEYNDFVNYSLAEDSSAYRKLKSKQILTIESEKETTINMLAVKLRTRKAYISDFTSLHMIVITLSVLLLVCFM